MHCIHNLNELDSIKDFTNYEVERFISGKIYHVDGKVSAGEFPYLKFSQYINTCRDFRMGFPLGSFTVDSPKMNIETRNLTLNILEAFEITNSASHLELIHDGKQFYFLEIGGRVGGGKYLLSL